MSGKCGKYSTIMGLAGWNWVSFMSRIFITGVATVGLFLLAAVSGCAQHSAKPDAASSQDAAAKPAAADAKSDDQQFRRMMDLVHTLDASSSKATQPTVPTSAAAAGTAARPAVRSAEPRATPPPAKESASGADAAKQPDRITTTVPLGPAGIAGAPAVSIGQVNQVENPNAGKPREETDLTSPLQAGAAVSAAEVAEVIKMLIDHPRVSYHSATGKYSYYAGGLIYAEYDTGDKWLMLRNDGHSPTGAAECRFSAEGQLLDTSKMKQSGSAAACSALVKRLFKVLERQ